MESLYPDPNPNWFFVVPGNESGRLWTKEENKRFEQALAIHDKNTADRWDKIAKMIPGKTVSDVINQYRELEDDVSDIEAGLVPIPGYSNSLDLMAMMDDNSIRFDGLKKRSLSSLAEQDKKKGVPWTEDEHKRFLMGLVKHGKGDWRNISRNFVITKTPTQVASHAQKYFIRLNSGAKDKRRPSIHDITTGTLVESATAKNSQSVSQEGEEKMKHTILKAPVEDGAGWNQDVKHRMEPVSMFDLAQEDLFTTLPVTYETDLLHSPKAQGLNMYQGARGGRYNSLFQAQSSWQRIVG